MLGKSLLVGGLFVSLLALGGCKDAANKEDCGMAYDHIMRLKMRHEVGNDTLGGLLGQGLSAVSGISGLRDEAIAKCIANETTKAQVRCVLGADTIGEAQACR